jgi:hypothetical protein
MTSSRSASRFIPLAGWLAVAVFLAFIVRFWHPVYGFTRFIQLDSSNDEVKIDAFKSRPIYVYRDTGGYDGLYYAQIAYDPLLRDPKLAASADNLGYRARRILVSALAWLFAFGNPDWIVHVYATINIVAWLIFAPLTWRLLRVHDLRSLLPWLGIMFAAGTIVSVRLALTDLVAVTLLAAAMLAQESARLRTATALLASAALARETAVLALTGLCDRPWFSWRNVVRAAVVALPLAAWLVYIRVQVGPANSGWGNFMTPLSGLARKWVADLQHTQEGALDLRVLAWATLFSTAALTVQALYFVVRWDWRDAWWRIGATYTALLCFLGTAVWDGFPGAVTRVLLPMTLAFNVLAARKRLHLAWLIAGNLSLGASFLHLVDLHFDPREIAAAHVSHTDIVGELGDGWSNVEHSSRRRWAWSNGKSTLAFKSWSGDLSQTVAATCEMRGSRPSQVSILQDGAVLWRGPVTTERSIVAFTFALESGRAQLEFRSDQPPVPEGPQAGARLLAFALYDLKLSAVAPSR